MNTDHSQYIQGLQSEDERDRAFTVEDIVYDGVGVAVAS